MRRLRVRPSQPASGGLGSHRPAQLRGSVRQRAGGADERRAKIPAGSRRPSERLLPFPEGGPEDEGKRRSGAPRGAPARVMGRPFPPAGGTGPIARRANGSAFRPATFGAPLPSFWECEGFETDNLARQSAGMRRAATLPHGSADARRNDEDEIYEACRLLSPHPEEPRSARRLEGWRRSPLWPTLRDARHWRAPQGEAQGQTPVWRNEPEVEFWRNEPETPKRLWAAGNCAEFSSP